MTDDTRSNQNESMVDLSTYKVIEFKENLKSMPPVFVCERITIEQRDDNFIVNSWSHGIPVESVDQGTGEKKLSVRLHCDCRVFMSEETAFNLIRGLITLMQEGKQDDSHTNLAEESSGTLENTHVKADINE